MASNCSPDDAHSRRSAESHPGGRIDSARANAVGMLRLRGVAPEAASSPCTRESGPRCRYRLLVGLLMLGAATTHAATFTVTSTASGGAGSLNQAIRDANSAPGADTINFNIAGAGVKVISTPNSGLPPITDTLTINGYSQPGASVNTLATGATNAVLMIEIDAGNLSGPLASALTVNAAATIRGLAIRDFDNLQTIAIRINPTGDGSSIRGCFLGTNAAGNASTGLESTAITVEAQAQIGGTAPADRNLIANTRSGVALFTGADGTVIEGNLFGTNAAGSVDQGNNRAIETGNVSISNFRIGGTAAGAGNVIANSNDSAIVLITPSSAVPGSGISILGNSIVNSTGLGIDLGDDGVDANDPGDADGGINGRENAPVLSFARLNGNSLRVYGRVDADFTSGNKRVEFFASPAPNPSGFGEGRTFLGSASINSGLVSVAFLRLNIALNPLPPLPFVVTATSTNADGSTSEFSNAIAVVDGGTVRTVNNVNDSGAGSLRQALLDAGAAGTDTIAFSITGSGPHVMAPVTALPSLGGSTIIDGYSQNFTRENHLQRGSNADLRIVLDLASAASSNGLLLSGGTSIIRGLVIANAGNVGIAINGGSNHRIEGNFVGTDVSGLQDLGSSGSGVTVGTGISGVTIGGTNPALRNLVSGNDGSGIVSAGTNVDVIGNAVGTAADDTTPIGNTFFGISMSGSGAVIGNRVRNNAGRGIVISGASTQVDVRANEVGSNAGLGLDLNGDNVTQNDVDDVDTGPNGLQNFPVLTRVDATPSGGVLVAGTLDRPAGAGAFVFELDVFRSGNCDGTHGEGETFLFTRTLNFAGGSPESFEVSAPEVTLAGGEVITATVTDAAGNSSEFSACRTATLLPAPIFSDGFE